MNWNFGSPGSVRARYHHLDHESFSYIITTVNNSNELKLGTVRLFLAPKYDELGNIIPLDEQKKLYIEMDKFGVELRPGKNTVVRSSTDSSVTISSTYTFKEFLHGEDLQEDRSEFCSCLNTCSCPKGMTKACSSISLLCRKGLFCFLFALLAKQFYQQVAAARNCNDALSYCDVMDEKYPDKRAMGYPLDRTIVAQNHAEFLTPNMLVSNITIRFQD
ncbi:hemocyanin A chain [Trichonephila inaurata madagascariensis]|uniref:Hemocyanin A chain n=1 Tax=Trichonephila inaurata madagascariensis TaxID=2747483 RepID=A0A8X6MA13_9ARAC|nr:hemocyanin A chain [Trichonephila inaurata madagascariensis]